MNANEMREEPDLLAIGDFSPRDADRLLAALTQAGVPFQIECDDGIYSYPPANAPSWGSAARIRVLVDRDKIGDAEKLRTKLLGRWRP